MSPRAKSTPRKNGSVSRGKTDTPTADELPSRREGAAGIDSRPESESVLTLIQRIKDRRVAPETLSAEDRRRCVELLRYEGYSVTEIAEVLKRHERTIFRDVDAIKAANALSVEPGFVERMTGETLRQAEISMTRLRKIARESGASAMERLMAEGQAWKVHKELIELLQSLGYLPKAATGIVAEIYQHGSVDPIATYDQLAQRIQQLQTIDAQTGYDDPQRKAQLTVLLDEMNRGRLEAQIERVNRPAVHTASHLEESKM